MENSAATEINSVLHFWFGKLEKPADYHPAKMDMWFKSGAEYDHEISTRFGQLHAAAVAGELNHWCDHAQGRLALIILLDQFSRHIYRGSSQAFSQDHNAQEWVITGLEKQHDLELRFIERSFFYLPLEHAENITLQNLAVERYAHLLEAVPEPLKEYYQGTLEYAEAHHKVIELFGRFPELNQILNRPSYPEEEQFLHNHKYHFL
ncbi:MAG: DUF924 family protein [Gammaproteobacteria bacterium]|nr:DUF924 family protein [Gammaproteobacteria bacterium]